MDSSRRNFLVAGIGLPAMASASRSANPEPQAPAKRASEIKFEYRILGKTGLKVTSVAFGCMITSDGSVVERAADMGITYFDTAHSYQQGNNERMVGAALKGKRNSITLSSKTHGAHQAGRAQRPGCQFEVTADRSPGYLVSARQEQAGRGHRRLDRRSADRQEGRQDPVRRASAPTPASRCWCRGWRRIPMSMSF